MMLNVTCKKCNTSFKLDISNDTLDQTKEKLSAMDTFSFCPGNHIEISSPINYLVFGDIVEGKIQTEKQWLKDMKKKGYKLISNDDIQKNYSCNGFSSGFFIGFKKDNPNDKLVLDFMRSPEGNRYYF